MKIGYRIASGLTGIGFVGLAISRLIAELFLGGEKGLYESKLTYFVLAFAAMFIFGSLIVFPLQLLVFDKIDQRSGRSTECHIIPVKVPWYHWFLVPLGLGNPAAQVPKPLEYLVKIAFILVVLIAILFFSIAIFIRVFS